MKEINSMYITRKYYFLIYYIAIILVTLNNRNLLSKANAILSFNKLF